MILQSSKISKTFVSEPVLTDVSFFLEEREKAAIVGINGAGKSTLLKIITGEIEADEGIVTIAKGTTVGYLAQKEPVSSSNTVYSEVMSAKEELNAIYDTLKELENSMKNLEGDELSAVMERYDRLNHEFESQNGYALVSEVTGVLKGLGFSEDDFQKPITSLSGGQKTRVALSKLLLKKPDLIMLDEPTNHLDIDSISWLETYLRTYPGAVLIVAHDRYFLDRIVTKVIEIERTKCTVYKGTYSEYAIKKEARRKEELRLYMKQQAEISHQEAVIKKLQSFNREKSIKRAESREKMLSKIERIEKPTELNDSMKFSITPSIESGNDVLHIENLSKSFGSLKLFSNLTLDIHRGDKVALIGKNGTGKTTVLKIINELLEPDTGIIRLGAKVHIGYYDQDHQVLHPDKTLFEEISDAYPDLNNTKIRSTLAAFLFTGDDVFKYVRDLSGGERGRLSLAKLMLSNANFLILDEPTNHLDMISKEILEDALRSYEGTILYVSHDRYFVNKTCTRIVELIDENFLQFVGNYDYYLEKRDDLLSSLSNPFTSGDTEKTLDTAQSKLSWEEQKAEKARLRKIESMLSSIESEIEEIETRLSEIDEEMSQPEIATDAAKCISLSSEAEEKNKRLEQLMEQWEELQE